MTTKSICLILWVLVGLSSCALYRPVPIPKHDLQQGRDQAREAMEPLGFRSAPQPTEYMGRYKQHYSLDFQPLPYRHHWGTFQSQGYTLVAQAFIPEQSRGTVFTLHGYADHIGMLRHLIRHCLKQGYTVVAFDMPGHGLSGGAHGAINSFTEYGAILGDFVAFCKKHVPGPTYLISHSTGSAMALEYLRHHPHNGFHKTIWVGPLVRHAYWFPVKWGFRFGQLTGFQSVGRKFGKVSSDRDFLIFRKNDPLAYKRIPAQWIAALYHWEKQIQSMAELSCTGLIIQGTRDAVIDKNYNVNFLQKKSPALKLHWIEGGRHQLYNESADLRNQVMNLITEELDTNAS